MTGHVSGPSEINLTARDYQDIDEDLAAARTSWAGVQRAAGSMNDGAAWRAAARDTASALDGAGKALAAKDRTAVARAVERLKNSYYELLSAIARARG